jgi:hypothetical protein
VTFLIGKFSVFGSILHGSMIRMLAYSVAYLSRVVQKTRLLQRGRKSGDTLGYHPNSRLARLFDFKMAFVMYYPFITSEGTRVNIADTRR